MNPSPTQEKKPVRNTLLDPRAGFFDEEFGDIEDDLDADRLTKIPGFIGKGTAVVFNTLTSNTLLETTKDTTGAIKDLFTEHILWKNEKPKNEQQQLKESKKQAEAIFHQQANQRLQQEQQKVISAEQQEVMMDVFRLGVDTSQDALDAYGKRKLTKADVFKMAIHQSEKNKKVEKQIEQANSQSIGRPNLDINKAAEGGTLSSNNAG